MEREANVEVLDFDKSQNIEVLVQEEVQLDINVPLFYIKSGEEDIKAYVNNHAKPELDAHTTSAVDKINQAEASSIADMEIAKDIQVAAVNQAGQIATENVAEDAIEIVDNHANSVTIPQLQEFTAEAQTQATSAATSASSALASKTSAESYATQAKTSETNAKSYADSIEPERFLSKEMITNCITEIPQDIKLELNNGTLTLKAGSKVYVPNGKNADGSNKFDEVMIAYDISLTQSWGSSQTFLLFYDTNGSRLRIYDTGRCYSGTTSVSDGAYYNTNDNKLYVYDGGSLNYEASLPIAVITGQSPTITSINQVFNGCGYIGSTVFTLPGGKGLAPNGRNADGSLRNIEYKREKLNLHNLNKAKNWVTFASNGEQRWECLPEYYTQSNVMPSVVGENQIWYNIIENQLYYKAWDKTEFEKIYAYEIFNFKSSSETFTPKLPFRAVDYSDKPEISGWGMPSRKKIALTLGASGTTYTAPASGYFAVGIDGLSNNWITFDQGTGQFQVTFVSPSKDTTWVRGIYSIAKGETVKINYGGTSSLTKYISFYYAEGEN